MIYSLLVSVNFLHLYGNNQEYNFRSIEVEDGLSQNMVYSILQDQQGFMWFGTQDGLNRYDGLEFKIFKKNKKDNKSIGSNAIFSMLQNKDGLIWVGTANGVYLYNPIFENFTHFGSKTSTGQDIIGTVRDIKKDKHDNIWMVVSQKGIFCFSSSQKLSFFPFKSVDLRKIEFDGVGNVWIATYLKGIIKLNPVTGKSNYFRLTNDYTNPDDNSINDLMLLNPETLLIGTVNRGMQMYNLKTNKFSICIEKTTDGNPLYVRRIYKANDHNIWIGTESGVYIFNFNTRKVVNLRHIFNNPYSISDNAVHSLYQDREGGMWIGTFFGGVNYLATLYSYFEKYFPTNGENAISGKSISEMYEDAQKNIWIGTEDAGLNLFNPATQTFTKPFLQDKNIHSLLVDGDKLWVGTFSKGLYKINLKTKAMRSYRSSYEKKSLSDDNIYSIYKDGSGIIWIGSMTGLQYYNAANDCFVRVKEQDIKQQVNDILEDYKGVLWFATIGNGLFSYDKQSGKWLHYASPIKNNGLIGKAVICLLQDRKNRLWIGTEGAGIGLFNRKNNSFSNVFTTDNGLPNDVIYKLIDDLDGNIWGSTNNGLFKINHENKHITIYTHENGLLGNQFNYKSGLRSSDGKLYFGGIKGFVAFKPNNLVINKMPPPVVINSFQIQNKEVSLTDPDSPIKQSVNYTKEIKLSYKTSVISVGFAALSYVYPKGNHFAYKLEGKDKEWIYTNQQNHHVNYSELPPNTYIFRVKASNSDGVWNEKGDSLKIIILPPYYKTVFAYLIYLLIFIASAYGFVRWYLDRLKQQNTKFLQVLERTKEKELYSAKIEFFTNITHEIRTPLSLIKSPLESVLKCVDQTDKNWEDLSIMQKNVNRLLRLVNELLDFRKAESKGLKLNFVNSDVLAVFDETISRFIPSAKLKGITININLQENSYFADIDPEIIKKILSNLLVNALKHAHKVIEIKFTHTADRFKFIINNDGELIPQKFAEKIFEPFFKLNENIQGTGLGLPFVRSLAELHGGSVVLDSSVSDKTVFIIELPNHQENSIKFEEKETQPDDINNNIAPVIEIPGIKSKKTILTVEDNKELQQFLNKQLAKQYRVIKANNGEEALEFLSKENVDMIVSDIAMPVMDGITLCKAIKENINYSHIPVILLTGKTEIESKIEGIQSGADEYIEKPYSIEYLIAKIENIFKTREKIRETYKLSPELAYNTIVHSKADEEFINLLVKNIHSRLEDVDLNVDQLAEVMNLSRATLYRKVSSISELTPNDFILLVRLKKAAELLMESDYRVNEIAYIVGFNSSSYFSKCFLKQFGVLPKNFALKHKSETNKDL